MSMRLDQLIEKAVVVQRQRKRRLADLLAAAEASVKAAKPPKKAKAGEVLVSTYTRVDPRSVTPESFALKLRQISDEDPHKLASNFLDADTFRLSGLSWDGAQVVWDGSPITTYQGYGVPPLPVTPTLRKAIDEVLKAATAYRRELAKKLGQALPMKRAERVTRKLPLDAQRQQTRRNTYMTDHKSKVLLEDGDRLWVWHGGVYGHQDGHLQTVYEVVPKSKFKGPTFEGGRMSRSVTLSSSGLSMYPGGEIYTGEVMTVKGQPYVHTGATMTIPSRPISVDFYSGGLVRAKGSWYLIVQEGNEAEKHPESFQALLVDKLKPFLAAVAKGDGFSQKFHELLASKRSLLPKPVRLKVDEVDLYVHRSLSSVEAIPELLREPYRIRDAIAGLAAAR